MAGVLVPEVSCERCPARQQGDGERTLQGLRARLRDSGWGRRWRGGVLVDLCPECDDQPHRTRHAQVPGQQTIDDLLADDENEEACDVVELR
jgi:hypothetical protein